MLSLAVRLADAWIARYTRPDPAALAAVVGLQPATVVTGGSEGIGLALARQFGRDGRPVVLVARSAGPLETAADLIRRDTGAVVHTLALDITTPRAAETLAGALAERGLYADLLINNAGIGQWGAFERCDPTTVTSLIDCNVKALSLLMRHFLPGMLARGRGGLLNVASLGGMAPGPFQSVYYASKAYVIFLTEAAAWEARGRGVRIAALAPGPVATRFHAKMGAEAAPYHQLIPATGPDRVAASTVRWFALGRRLIFPGILANCLAIMMRFAPRPLVIPVIGWLLGPDEGRTDV